MLIITAPGQGAQTPGFLAPWLELPGVTELLGTWSELAKCDLITAGTTADADQIRDTAVAQPLLVAAGLAAAAALDDGDPAKLPADATAGHSVGELTAGVIAGVIGADDALRLVSVRGAAMAAATEVTPTGMTAVLGGDEQEVLSVIARHGLTPANINLAGQIVAAGTLDQLSAFAADPPAGARLRPLQVAGAFHTTHMAPAVAALGAAARDVDARNPVCTLLSNADGAAVATGRDWLDRIVAQVAAPVRWDACLATMKALGVTAMIELPPAGTLIAMAKRALPGVEFLAVKTPDQLAAARELIEAHLVQSSQDHLPEWRLIVAPATGTFRAPEADPEHADVTGPGLGIVVARGGERAVSAPWPADIIEWLVEDGDPVSEGQPLVRVQPGPGWTPGSGPADPASGELA
jgi:[acyl-carrier-protein] S-malonyltransferase